MRKPIIVGNWKMNTTLADAEVLATQIKNSVGELDVDVVLCPPFPWLYPVSEILSRAPKNLHLGGQNMWHTDSGAMTGEVSAPMIKSLAKYIILGHSERRLNLDESDELINKKLHQALNHNLKPILCVGEIKKNDSDLVLSQFKKALKDINRNQAEEIVVAYEPVWAIGTGEAATGAYAADVIGKLRQIIVREYNQNLSERMRFLYGGSVTAANVREFVYQPEIDGVLAGGASLKAKEFIEICREASGRE